MKYQGGCHCGNISFEVEGDIDSVLECNCSICSKRGYLLWFAPRDRITLKNSPDNMATYSFNKKVIRHNFCPRCGCAPLGFGADEKGNEMASVNVRCLENFDLSSVTINHYDGRSA